MTEGQVKVASRVFIGLIFLFVAICIGLFLFLSNANNKDLIQKGLVENVRIENEALIFSIKEGYASGLNVGYDSKTVYSEQLGKKISTLKIENYSSIFNDKNIYHFMLYHYEWGGHQFSGFDFCIDKSQVYYGKELKNCLKEK